MDKRNVKQSISTAAKALWQATPTVVAIILLICFIKVFLPKESYGKLFYFTFLPDSVIGALLGSILAGNPIISYIIANELLMQGISLTAITAFLIAWVTVGIVQLPAEAILLGKKFAIIRNSISFVLVIFVSTLVVLLLDLLR